MHHRVEYDIIRISMNVLFIVEAAVKSTFLQSE